MKSSDLVPWVIFPGFTATWLAIQHFAPTEEFRAIARIEVFCVVWLRTLAVIYGVSRALKLRDRYWLGDPLPLSRVFIHASVDYLIYAGIVLSGSLVTGMAYLFATLTLIYVRASSKRAENDKEIRP